MKIDHIHDFPTPPSNRVGWPWDCTAVSHTPQKEPNPWPRISIVTPSYNQAQYLEETVRSVLLQGYPNLEYIIMDGASTDGSFDILQKYSDWFDFWTSAKDGGQAAAIAAGLERATGEIVGFINSDDVLLPGALFEVGQYFSTNQTAELVVGKSVIIDTQSKVTYLIPGLAPTFRSLLFWSSGGFNQPATFWRRIAMLESGMFDASCQFSFDYDLYLRLTKRQKAYRLDRFLAAFRVHPTSKTSTLQDVHLRENTMLRQRHGIDKYPDLYQKMMWIYFRSRYSVLAGLFKLRIGLGLEQLPHC